MLEVIETRPLQEGIENLQKRLGADSPVLTALAGGVRSLTLERFQSVDFVRAGFAFEQGREQEGDGCIWVVDQTSGDRTFLVAGKGKGGPYSLAWGGVDFRPDYTVVGRWSKDSLRITNPVGIEEVFTGEEADIEPVLGFTRQKLGRRLKTINFE